MNWEGLKNRIGGYHEPENTVFDPTFLKTLDEAEMRNGVAEILKITSCTHQQTFNLLEEHGPKLLKTRFAQTEEDRGSDLFVVADRITRQGKFRFQLKSDTLRHTLISPGCTKSDSERFRCGNPQ